MKIGRWAGLGLLAALPLLTGCGNFWQDPNSSSTSSFSLTASPTSLTVGLSATSTTSTITVTPGSSFTGTVALTCAVTTTLSGATAPTCNLGSTSLTFSSSTAQTTTVAATTGSGTTLGAYTFKITGVSGNIAESTSVCVEVSTSSGTCSTAATTSGNFYVLSGTSIAGYTVNSGSLTAISGSKTVTGATAIAMAPSGNFLEVATANGILPFTINTSTGALTEDTTAIFGDPDAQAIQVDPSGNWLLDASADGTLKAYPITTAGALNTGTIYTLSLGGGTIAPEPGGIAISPSGYTNGSYVAVATGSNGTVVFPFTSSNTTSTPFGTPSTIKLYGGGAAISVAIDPQNRLLYIGETDDFSSSTTNSGGLRVFTIASSGPTELTSTPYAPLGTGPHAILPDKTGDYVYVASWQTGTTGVITGYSVTTSALTALTTTVSTGTEPKGLAEDNTKSFVLAVSYSGGPYFDAYTLTAGQPSSPATGSTVTDPIAIVAAP